MTNRRIILITTNGCKGCRIQRENIQGAIKNSSKDIALDIESFEDMTKAQIAEWRKKRIFLKDFPTTIFVNNDIITFHAVGSFPKIVITRYIDLYLK